MKPIVLRNVGDIDIVVGISLKIFYNNRGQWLKGTDFVDALVAIYLRENRKTDNTSGGQGIAKMKPALYFGLLDYKNENGLNFYRINQNGIRFYEAYISEDEDTMVDILIDAIKSMTFGTNNPAVPASNSSIEPPKVAIIGSLILGHLSKEEYAYSLQELDNGKPFFSTLSEIAINRKMGNNNLPLNQYSQNNYKDDKGILFLCQSGLTIDNIVGNPIKDKYVEKYRDVIRSLSIYNDLFNNDLTNTFTTKVNNYYTNFLTAIRTKPFLLLAGISGTGKSRIVRKLAQATVTKDLQELKETKEEKREIKYEDEEFEKLRWKLHSPANFEIIQVKPNWHNSYDVVGYASNIPDEHYTLTPFIDFIVNAWHHLDVPFFLCLDEMNLAPVEEYFAEFLSSIESRSFDEEGNYMTDPIIKPTDKFGSVVAGNIAKQLNDALIGKDEMDSVFEKKLRTKGLTLPPNLIVIGTVNMDETTFSFSRKVLDRAMSIEMNEVDYDRLLTGGTDDGIKDLRNIENLNDLLVNRYISADEVIDKLGGTSPNSIAVKVINYLKRINALFEGSPFKLGYRVANEALIYVQSAEEFGQSDIYDTLDNFTLMKILSRIEGDETKLQILNSDERLDDADLNSDDVEDDGKINILTCLRRIIAEELGEYCESNENLEETTETENIITDDTQASEANDINEDTEGTIINEESEEDNGNSPIQGEDAKTYVVTNKTKRHSIKKIDQMINQLKIEHFVSYWN